jgi:uncharacterized membrane protein
MIFIKKLILLSFFVVSLFSEEITSFKSNIEIHKDGSMIVDEIINIDLDPGKRGIFRDFPTQYKDKYGNYYNVKFDVLNVTKNEKSVNYEVSQYKNGYRLKIGNLYQRLKGGNYTYKISYKTNRQLGFFKEHDELYWNVIGAGWPFFINSVYVKVTLPKEVLIKDVVAYTGMYGQTQGYYKANFENNVVEFTTTKILKPYEGFTIAVAWPKGFIKEPSLIDKIKWFFADNFEVLLLILFIFFILLYFVFVWWKYARDSKGQAIIPLFEPPVYENQVLLPADLKFILKKKIDNQGFSLALVDMAVKGYVLIEKLNSKYILKKKDKDPKEDIYRQIIKNIFIQKNFFKEQEIDQLAVTQSNSSSFISGINTLRKYLKDKFDNTLIIYNRGWWVVGFLASVITGVFAFNNFIPVNVLLLSVLALINIIFFFALETYTEKGKRLQAQILGFKMFLSFTEKERLKYTSIPDRTPQEYETFLPYAMALAVEKNWTNQFSTLFEQMAKEGAPYIPYWYVGSYRNFGGFNKYFVDSFSSSFSNSISSASTPPGSTSGFGGGGKSGGGFSGGGGGGGGGGSW